MAGEHGGNRIDQRIAEQDHADEAIGTGQQVLSKTRAAVARGTRTPGAYHNTGGLAFWFLRAERYQRTEGMPFRLVRERAEHSKEEAKDGVPDHLWATPELEP